MVMFAVMTSAVQRPGPVTLSYALIMTPQDCEIVLFYATIPEIYLKNGQAHVFLYPSAIIGRKNFIYPFDNA
jgi:hypothetical protein